MGWMVFRNSFTQSGGCSQRFLQDALIFGHVNRQYLRLRQGWFGESCKLKFSTSYRLWRYIILERPFWSFCLIIFLAVLCLHVSPLGGLARLALRKELPLTLFPPYDRSHFALSYRELSSQMGSHATVGCLWGQRDIHTLVRSTGEWIMDWEGNAGAGGEEEAKRPSWFQPRQEPTAIMNKKDSWT